MSTRGDQTIRSQLSELGDDDLLTLAEMAEVLRVSYYTITKWTQRGYPDFPGEAFKLPNGEWRCRRRDLMRWAVKRAA